MSRNPINETKTLLESLKTLLNSEHTQRPGPQKTLGDTMQKANEILEALTNLDAIVPLDIKEEKEQFTNYKIWKDYAGGKITPKDGFFEDLIKKSPTLFDLRKSGLAIEQLEKFKADELAVAEIAGNNFITAHFAINQLKNSLTNNKFQTWFFGNQLIASKKLIEELKQEKLFSGYKISVCKHSEKKYEQRTEINLSQLPKIGTDDKILLEFEDFNPKYKQLLIGDWFNAYAYSTIEKQLKDFDLIHYELYTKVKYQGAREVISTAGDFDVLVRIGNQIISIECKSGKIGPDNPKVVTIPPDITKVLRKADDIDKLFKKVKSKIENFTSWLIYNPNLKENKSIKNQMAGTPIKVLDPTEIRGAIADVISNLTA